MSGRDRVSARNTALEVLVQLRRRQAWSDGALKQALVKDRLDRRDAALCTRLVYGVLQNRMLLDYWIDEFLTGPRSKLQPVVEDILRLGVYQLRFLDKIPGSAVVNEAVNQTKRTANVRAAGLVNGVLRAMLRSPERLAMPEELALRFSHPARLVELLEQNVGREKLSALLASHNEIPPTYLQVNPLRGRTEEILSDLEQEGNRVSLHPWMPDCLLLHSGAVEHTRAFAAGQVYVQDPAARLAVLAAGMMPEMNVLDCCAAPGGKSIAAAIAMENRGTVTACDLHPHKIPLIEKNAERLGLSEIHAMVQDASSVRPAWNSAFDVVLADVPCSGLGVIRKKPDIRYKDVDQLENLPLVQSRILAVQCGYVKPGGVLLYSTCTILRRENQDVVHDFLQAHPEFVPEEFRLPGGIAAEDGMLTLYPCDHDTDGFFICKLRRLP